MRRIAIASIKRGWHTEQLDRAFREAGCAAQTVDLAECSFSSESDYGLCMPGFTEQMPDAVFVRGIAGGSLEQVVYYLGLLHALSSLGVVVYNPPYAIERSVDKAMTTFLLKEAGLNTPKTWVSMDIKPAQRWLDKMTADGGMVVSKPVFGSQGKGIELLRQGATLADMPGKDVYYLQEFIDSGDNDRWCSWRLFVVDGRVVTAVERVNKHWLNNVACGGECRQAWPEPPMLAMAEAAVAAVGLFYSGVDVIRDRQRGLWLIELNSMPAWQGLQAVSHLHVASLLVKDCLRRCQEA